MTQKPELPPPPMSREEERMAAFKAKVDYAVEAFNELLEVPSTSSATFLPRGPEGISLLHLATSHRSVSQLNKRTGSQTLTLSSKNAVLATSPIAFTSADVVHSSLSPDGLRTAVFRKNADKEGAKKLTIEVWDAAGTKETEIEVGDKHQDLFLDDTFGPPSWHPRGTALVYTAEATPPSAKGSLSSFEYVADFGEKFTGKRAPSIFLLLLPSKANGAAPTIHQLTDVNTPTSGGGVVAFGQPILLPDDGETPRVLATGYKSLGDERRLGIVYCTNRPSAIYELELAQVGSAAKRWKATGAVRQSEEGRSARSARVFIPPHGIKVAPIVVFLSNAEGGVHGGCSQLHAVALSSGNTAVLVAQVDQPKTGEDFPGLYLDQLPQRPFVVLAGVPHLALASLWRTRRVPLLISLKDGAVQSLAPWASPSEDPVLPYLGHHHKVDLTSTGVLGTDGTNRIVGLRSSPLCPPELVVIDLSAKPATWTVLKKAKLSSRMAEASAFFDYTVLPLPKFEPTEFILVSPCPIDPSAESSPSLPPLITFPHGGPHSGTATDFSAMVFSYVLAGYRVALVNYPGSLGYGQKSVMSLPPELGKLDVEATLATPHFLNTLSLASRKPGSRLYVGGSHSGFIGAHLAGQYPDDFDAQVLRNAVTDLGSMLFATDIPDWTYTETDMDYSLTKPPAALPPATYERLHAASPMAHVDKVTVPTLLLVGESDRRVPPDQSRAYFHALKRNGLGSKVQMHTFPGNGHALDSTVETEVVAFELGLRFLQRFTSF